MIDFSNEDVAPLIRRDGAKPRETKRFDILSLTDLANMPDPEWLINGVLPKRGVVEMHGMPATGKSFIALDMALHIATGSSWHGHSTEQGRVLYVAAEGATGYKRRVDAWKASRGLHDIDALFFVASGVQLHEEIEVEGLLDSLNVKELGVSLVIFDTLARCFVGGDENSSAAMGTLLEGASKIGDELDATVLLVHHTRKDGATERGSIALRGGVDAMMSVERELGKQRFKFSSIKMKNAADFHPLWFELVPTAESCIIEAAAPPKTSPPRKSRKEIRIDNCLALLPLAGASHGEWMALIINEKACPASTFNKYLKELLADGIVTRDSDGKYYKSSST